MLVCDDVSQRSNREYESSGTSRKISKLFRVTNIRGTGNLYVCARTQTWYYNSRN
jgi:hypothetical protein